MEKKNKILHIISLACIAVLLVTSICLGVFVGILNKQNQDTQVRLEQVETENDELKQQIDDINKLIMSGGV